MDYWFIDDRYPDQELEREFQKVRQRKKVDPLGALAKAPELEEIKIEGEDWEQYLSGRVNELAQAIEQLKEEMRTRADLRDYFVSEIDHQILYAQSSLKKFSDWGLGYNTGVDVKRNWLEKQLADLRKERRRVHLQCFDDLIDLRGDLREAIAEYRQLSRRQRLLKGGDTDGD